MSDIVKGMGLAAGIAAASFFLGRYVARLEDKQEEEPLPLPRVSDAHSHIFNRDDIVDVRISDIHPVISPTLLAEELDSEVAQETVRVGRNAVASILNAGDDRLLVIVGPCSIHDPKAGIEYAKRLVKLAHEHSKELLVVMRVYFEKPRTTIGWKGLINDPDLNGTHNINKGIRLARGILLEINNLGLPCGAEFLDTISPQYIADLVCWGAIGARTTESQVHRELSSGLSMPVGFKNGTSGDVQVAIDAVRAALYPHSFLSVTTQGTVAIVSTDGNPDCHLILRGGAKTTNYDKDSIASATALLEKAKLEPRIIVDCSHGNSQKLHTNQPKVVADIASQLESGTSTIKGVMIESNLKEGNQPEPLKNGGKVCPLFLESKCFPLDIDVRFCRSCLLHVAAIGVW
mmetsp:Transcript_31198/g.48839  ORF Transcript_31198/g.48839 Transcript_31198/m.48839 type:complete len:403 (-) Transcript_31198:2106-3314(-)